MNTPKFLTIVGLCLIITVLLIWYHFFRVAKPPKFDMSSVPQKQKLEYVVREVTINQIRIWVEVADSEEKRNLGLAYRSSLGEDQGMLFLMRETSKHGFWMNEMKIPLDVIWVKSGKIVDITENVLPPTQTNGEIVRMNPNAAYDQVIEVNSGFVQKWKVKLGDEVVVKD